MTETVTASSPKLYDIDPTLGGLNGTDGEDWHHQYDILNMLKFADNTEKTTCPSDDHIVSDSTRAKVSYGINWFMYAQHKPGWGGSQTIYDPGLAPQVGSGSAGNYGPRQASIQSPSLQIFSSDQLQFDGEPAKAALTWHWPEAGLVDLARHSGRFVAAYHDGHVVSKDPLGLFGFAYLDPSTTMLNEAVTNRGWPAGMPPAQTGGPDGADFAAYIFPHFAAWRGQPFQRDR